MQQRKRKYLLSILIIGSIFALSVKDTLEVVHAFLHAIPNPFHHHDLEGHAFYHHQNDPRQSFFSYGNHKHSLEDHVHSAKKNKHSASSQKDKSEKQDLEKSLKTNLFVNDLCELRFYFAICPKSKMLNNGSSFFDYLHSSPPSPPPDMV
jgi:hypothetical protein